MALIFFARADGALFEAEGRAGQTVLQVAEAAGIDGFLAECGGSCSCGTCHCYVHPEDWARLALPESAEHELLDFVAAERRDTSRLACQVRLPAEPEGLRFEIPSRQI